VRLDRPSVASQADPKAPFAAPAFLFDDRIHGHRHNRTIPETFPFSKYLRKMEFSGMSGIRKHRRDREEAS
jgi:hypothetical protein